MRRIKLLSLFMLCAFIAFFGVGCSTSGYDDMTTVIKSQYPTVVSISSSKGSGSGVLILEGGYIATNLHVISSGTGGAISFPDKITVTHWTRDHYDGSYTSHTNATKNKYTHTFDLVYGENLLYYNESEDLAIIRSDKTYCSDPKYDFSGVAASLRGASSPLIIGEPVAALGSSFGLLFRASVGVVSQTMDTFRGDVDGVSKEFNYAVIHDATIIGGNSGGPVFDRDGRVIGLTTLIFNTDTSLGSQGPSVPAFGFAVAISARVIYNAMQSIDEIKNKI